MLNLIPTPTRILLLRHGRSTYNDQGRYQGNSDQSILNPTGLETTCQLSDAIHQKAIDAIYVSPLKRAQQTVDALLQNVLAAPSIYVDEALREIDLPAWQGLSYQYVREHFKHDYQHWIDHPETFQMTVPAVTSSSETSVYRQRSAMAVAAPPRPFYPVQELYQRAQQFWQRILPRHQGQTILVVSHGGTNHALISTALGLPVSSHHRLQQSNCGLTILEFPRPDQFANLRQLNCTLPIGETLPKLKAGKRGLRLLLLPHETIEPKTELIPLLFNTHLDFCIHDCQPAAQRIADEVIRNHPETLFLQVSREDFLQAWQTTLRLQKTPPEALMTGLVIAKPGNVQSLIAQAIDLDLTQVQHLNIKPGTLSILHYPSSTVRPILQAMNWSQPLLDS